MHLTSIQNTAFTILRMREYIPMYTIITWDVFMHWKDTPEYKRALAKSEYVWKKAKQMQKEKRNADSI